MSGAHQRLTATSPHFRSRSSEARTECRIFLHSNFFVFHLIEMIPHFEAVSATIDCANARIVQSKSPSRKRYLAASLHAEKESKDAAAASVLDEVSSSSSCFPSEITSESATFYAKSKRPRKINHAVEDLASQEFRRITRSYAKRKEKLNAQEENAVNIDRSNVFPGFSHETKSLFNTVLKASSSFTTSGTSNVSVEFCDENREARNNESLEMSDSNCPHSTSLASARDFDISSRASQGQDQRGLENLTDFSCSENLSETDETPGFSSSAPTLTEFGSDLLDKIRRGSYSSDDSSSLVYDSSDDCSDRKREKSGPSFLSFLLGLGSEFCPSPKEFQKHEHEYAHEFTVKEIHLVRLLL